MDESNLEHQIDELSLQAVAYGGRQTMHDHSHNRASIGVVVAGQVTETVEGQTSVQSTGALVMKPAGVVHRNEFGATGAVILSIRNLAADVSPKNWSWRHQPTIARRALAIIRELALGDPFGAAQELGWSLVAIASAVDRNPLSNHAPSWLARIHDDVADAHVRPSIGSLARSVGVHPVYLTRVFRRSFGYSIGELARRRRIERVADNLLSSRDSVVAIAARHGFADQSHLCRVFNAELGVPPSLYRSLVSGMLRTPSV